MEGINAFLNVLTDPLNYGETRRKNLRKGSSSER